MATFPAGEEELPSVSNETRSYRDKTPNPCPPCAPGAGLGGAAPGELLHPRHHPSPPQWTHCLPQPRSPGKPSPRAMVRRATNPSKCPDHPSGAVASDQPWGGW